jgi:microcystin-dependent protein
MSEPYVAEIRLVAFNFPPKGWAFCNGQLLPINQNQALFSILGTTYGGDGQQTFALPDLRGRTPIHFGKSPLGQPQVLGARAGEETHTLTVSEVPAHAHTAVATSITPAATSPAGGYWGNAGISTYSSNAPNTTMDPNTISSVGGSQPHPNLPPYLVVSFVIALQGIFPSRN